MKIKLPEHDHKLTNILKVLLFSLLMLLPFLDIGTRCSYVLLNKNAYQSYSGNISQTQTISYDLDELQYNEEYTYLPVEITGTTTIFGDYISYLKSNNTEVLVTGYTSMYLSGQNIIFLGDNLTNIYETNSSVIKVEFKYIRASNTNVDSLDGQFKQTKLIENSQLDNVFDYSIDKMANSALYNWTTQTGMYTGVNAMTTGLGITTPLFAILITYWMFLTIIYIILDIVLSLFTFMTHIFTKKE